MKERTKYGEKIGGGYIVMRRSRSSGRVRVSPIGMPFEHPSASAAKAEADRLAAAHPGKTFCVFAQIHSRAISPEGE